jgi:hypothetical protein
MRERLQEQFSLRAADFDAAGKPSGEHEIWKIAEEREACANA